MQINISNSASSKRDTLPKPTPYPKKGVVLGGKSFQDLLKEALTNSVDGEANF